MSDSGSFDVPNILPWSQGRSQGRPPPAEEQPARGRPPPSGRDATRTGQGYEADRCGWLYVKREARGRSEYHIAIAAPKNDKSKEDTHSLCVSCVGQLRQQEQDILWSNVDRHLKPVRPHTKVYERWIQGKLSFERAANGEWQKKFPLARWENRFFRFGPNGLQYSRAETSKKEKNSKVYTLETEIIRDVSPEEFKVVASELRQKDFYYLGLRFKENGYEEALLMRLKDREYRNEVIEILENSLNQLKQDEKWAHASQPIKNKNIASNYLARLAEYRRVIVETRELEESELAEKNAAERQAAAARAATEHHIRTADRSEGEVATLMSQIRNMTKGLEKERAEAKRENLEALQQLADAKRRQEESAMQLTEAEDALGRKVDNLQNLQQRIDRLRGERDSFVDEKNKIFARWRKMEEMHASGGQQGKRSGSLLAFSPPDSPCHPLRLSVLTDAEANRVIRSYTASPQSTLIAPFTPAAASPDL